MKRSVKILNFMGYISLLLIPCLWIICVIKLQEPLRIFSSIILFVLLGLNIVHFSVKKVKLFGIRIFTTIMLLVVCTYISYIIYNQSKDAYARNLVKEIDRIQINSFANDDVTLIEGENIDFEYYKDASIFIKGQKDCQIFYKDGTSEFSQIFNGNLLSIGKDKFYIREKP